MNLAAARLAHSRDSVAEIGLALGYESEKSFSAAFKRIMKCAPRQYGRQQTSGGESGPDAAFARTPNQLTSGRQTVQQGRRLKPH
ncbi:helix-turn-helix domain-containing protein [Paraburkholderia sp. XV]|uniref:helix-turn-helix domain-containing protein n=1 Tax=Paraburkholderia sp. XV TaxID=2831520 RepID=UPI001CD2ACA7|nr:helix-turn-helix domain-containing protein [Paraburkholderia sp. XV]